MIGINTLYEGSGRVYVNKHQSGWNRPEDFNIMAWDSIMGAFNYFKENYESDKTSQDALHPFTTNYIGVVKDGVLTMPPNTERIISIRGNQCSVLDYGESDSGGDTIDTDESCSTEVKAVITYVDNTTLQLGVNDTVPITINGCEWCNILPSSGNNISNYENAVGKGSYGISRNPCKGGQSRYEIWGTNSSGEKLYRVTPKSITTAFVKYLRTPKKPIWGYTVSNGTAIYNPATSVDVEFDEQFYTHLVQRIASLFGITIRETELIQLLENHKQKL